MGFSLNYMLLRVVLSGFLWSLASGVSAQTDCESAGGGDRLYATGKTTVARPEEEHWGGGSATWENQWLYNPDWRNGGFASQVLWVGTRQRVRPIDGWMEVGYTHGWQSQNLRTYYWAEGWCERGQLVYHEHRISGVASPARGANQVYSIEYKPNAFIIPLLLGLPGWMRPGIQPPELPGGYVAFIGGRAVAVSFQPYTTKWVHAGFESNSSRGQAGYTRFRDLKYREWAWPSPWSFWSRATADGAWEWIRQYDMARNYANLRAQGRPLFEPVEVLPPGPGPDAPSESKGDGPYVPEALVAQKALEIASSRGVTNPQIVQTYLTTYAGSAEKNGHGRLTMIDGDREVYVVYVNGDCLLDRGPEGAVPRLVHHCYYLFAASDGEQIGFGTYDLNQGAAIRP